MVSRLLTQRNDVEDPAPMLWIIGARGRPGLTCQNQHIPTSQLVAMVCGNYHIDHTPEECFLNEHICDCTMVVMEMHGVLVCGAVRSDLVECSVRH